MRDINKFELGDSDPSLIEKGAGYVWRLMSPEEVEEQAADDGFIAGLKDGQVGNHLPSVPEDQICRWYLAGWRKGYQQFLQQQGK